MSIGILGGKGSDRKDGEIVMMAEMEVILIYTVISQKILGVFSLWPEPAKAAYEEPKE